MFTDSESVDSNEDNVEPTEREVADLYRIASGRTAEENEQLATLLKQRYSNEKSHELSILSLDIAKTFSTSTRIGRQLYMMRATVCSSLFRASIHF